MSQLFCAARLFVALTFAVFPSVAPDSWNPGAAVAEQKTCAEPVPSIFQRLAPSVVLIESDFLRPHDEWEQISRLVGSGFLIEPTGVVLTAYHVVAGSYAFRVTLHDGRRYTGELVGTDAELDLAVVQLQADMGQEFPAATLGNSDELRIGDDVMAIGYALALSQGLTRGIVSAMSPLLSLTPLSHKQDLIQTDTSLNFGNSGGPLVNRCGEVVGIGYASIPEAQNIGFALPIELVKAALPSLLTQGRVMRPWVGVHGKLVDDSLRDLLAIPLEKGFLIEAVDPGSPAEEAGLLVGDLDIRVNDRSFLIGGDIITMVNGKPLASPEALANVARSLEVGTAVNLKLFRKGKHYELEFVLPEKPSLPWDLPGRRDLVLEILRRRAQNSPY